MMCTLGALMLWGRVISILCATMLGCWISSKICSMMCTLGALMLWGRVISTSTISTMLSLLAMIISLKNMTAGLVPAILTVSSNSLRSMGLFSTSTKMALISSTVCMAITFVRDFRTAVVCLDPKFWTSLRASATRVNFSTIFVFISVIEAISPSGLNTSLAGSMAFCLKWSCCFLKLLICLLSSLVTALGYSKRRSSTSLGAAIFGRAV